MIPQPVQPRPGSSPMISTPPPRSRKPFHNLGRHFVIAPNRLDVVVLLERLDQADQPFGVVARNPDAGLSPPAQADALGRAERGFERARHRVKIVDGSPDLVAFLVGIDVGGTS